MTITHDKLVQLSARWLFGKNITIDIKMEPYKMSWKENGVMVEHNCGESPVHIATGNFYVVATEIGTWFSAEIPDVIGFANTGNSAIIECKISRSDFLADKKKPFRTDGTGMGNFRMYCCPKGMILPDELPENWGLLETSGRGLKLVVAPKKIELANSSVEHSILVSIIRRIKSTIVWKWKIDAYNSPSDSVNHKVFYEEELELPERGCE